MTKNMTRFRASVESGVKSLFSLRTAAIAAAGVSGLFLLAKRAVSTADEIGKMARQIGVTAEELQELRFAADRSGVSQDKLDQSLVAFTKRLGEAKQGTGEARAALDELGISMADLEDKTPVQALELVADRLRAIEDPMRRNAILSDLFSRAGIRMGNVLADGADEMNKLRQRARDLGVVLSNDIVARAETAADELGDMSKVLSVAATSAGLELLPAMRALAQAFTDPQFIASMREIGNLLSRLIIFFVNYHKEILTVAAALIVFAKAQDIGGKRLGKASLAVSGLLAALAGLATNLIVSGEATADTTAQVEKLRQQMDALGVGGGSVDKAAAAVAKLNASLQTQNQEMQDLVARYRTAPGSVQALKDTIELENAARQANIDLSTEQGRTWADLFSRGQELRRVLADVERITSEAVTPQQAYTNEVARLNELLAAGFINQQQFNKGLEAAKGKLEKVKDESKALQSAATDLGFTFSSAFEDAVIEGQKLSEVLKGLEKDILRIILRTAVTEPLANAVTGLVGSALGSLFNPGTAAIPAKPGLSSVPGPHLQHGGVFTKPTRFGMVGEAGPEAVLPLTKVGNDLGVKAVGGGGNVQVIIQNNNPDNEVHQERRSANGQEEVIVRIDRALGAMAGRGEGHLFRSIQRTFGSKVSPVAK